MNITRKIERHQNQTFVLSKYHCMYCGGKGYYEYDYEEANRVAYCPHCKQDDIHDLYNPDVTLPLLNEGKSERIVDERTWMEEVTRTEEEWAYSEAVNESMRRFSRMLSASLYGDPGVPDDKVYGLPISFLTKKKEE